MITVKGDKAMAQKIRAIADQFPDEAAAALHLEAEMIMTRSKRDHVPVDFGVLRGSGFVNPPEGRGQDLEVTLGYGGAASSYAVAVHEHPGPFDPPSWQGKGTASSTQRNPPTPGVVTFHPKGRGPKYLERPMRAAVKGMAERIAERIAAGLA